MLGIICRVVVAGLVALFALAGMAWGKPVSVTVHHPPPAVTGSPYNQVEVTAIRVDSRGNAVAGTRQTRRMNTSESGEGTVEFDLDPGRWKIAVTQSTSRRVEDARGRECGVEGRGLVQLSVDEEGAEAVTIFLGPEDFVSQINECSAHQQARDVIRLEWGNWIIREFDRGPTLAKSRELEALRQRINARTKPAQDSAEKTYLEAKARSKAAAEQQEQDAPEDTPRETPRGDSLEGLPGFGRAPGGAAATQGGIASVQPETMISFGGGYFGIAGLGTASNAGLNHPVTGANTALLNGPTMLHGFSLSLEAHIPLEDPDISLADLERFANRWRLNEGWEFKLDAAHASGSTQAYSPIGGQNKFFSFLFPKLDGCTLVNPCINYSLPANATDLAARVDQNINTIRIAAGTN